MTTLQKTIISKSGHKFEIYAKAVNGPVDRVIEYRLRTLANQKGQDSHSESAWLVLHSNVDIKGQFYSGTGMPLPGQEPNCVDNVAHFFSKQ
ncbi:hypothetical protein [Huaxiibacter chinensis]